MNALSVSRHVVLSFALGCCVMALGGCFPKSEPLASLPLTHPDAAQLNLQGIDHYQRGRWEEALALFRGAIRSNPQFPEAHFNAALTLHQLGRHEEAAEEFRRAGELDPDNPAITQSTLYRNYLGLSSTLERHLSGGYRYGTQ